MNMCAGDEETNRICVYSTPTVNFLYLYRLIKRMCTRETNGFHTYLAPTSNSLLIPAHQTAASHSIIVVMPCQRPVSCLRRAPVQLTPPFAVRSSCLHLTSMSPRLSSRYPSCSCHSLFAAFMTHCRLVAPLFFFSFFSDADMLVRPKGIQRGRGQMAGTLGTQWRVLS